MSVQWVRYRSSDGHVGMGVLRDDQLIPVSAAELPPITSLRDVMRHESVLRYWLTTVNDQPAFLGAWELLAPVDQPEKIICVGLNYRAHALETGKQPPSEPVIFGKLPSALIGPGDPIILPKLSEQVDYEAELVVVIGKTCCQVSEADALDHVFGYCCGHDVSSRDWQYHHSGGQWLLGKSFDTFAPVGPYVVARESVPNPEALRIQMHLNDQTMQDSSTSDLIFSIPYLISYLSHIFTFKPGDLIFTGTPSGVGVARDPQRFLKPGDQCTVEIESLGRLSNPVIAHDSSAAIAWRETHQ